MVRHPGLRLASMSPARARRRSARAARYPDDVRRTWKPLIRQRQWFNLRPQRLSPPGEWVRRKRKKRGEGGMTGAQAEPDGNGDVAGHLPTR